MTDYRNTDEKFAFNPNTEKLYKGVLSRLKPNRMREDTLTGPEPDGKTPFMDVFHATCGEPYPIRLAKSVVESWMVTEPVIYDGDYLIGTPRPIRPLVEHFSFGITQARYILGHAAYIGRRDEILDFLDKYGGELNQLNMSHVTDEGRRRFDTGVPVYDRFVEGQLWWVGGYQGHTVPDYRILMNKGVGGIIADIEAELACVTDEAERLTLTACLIVMRGFSDWILMQAVALEDAASAGGEYSDRYKRCAAVCRSIAIAPPRDFYSAAQLTWFYSLWDSVDCLGRCDQYLYPFFEKSLSEDRDLTENITACLMLKFFEHGVHNITVGGIRPSDGEDAANDLTFFMLQILRTIHDTHPRMTVRVNEKSDPALLALAVRMWSEGMSDPTVASDTLIIPSFIEYYGVKPTDAADYTILGCQELEIPGRSYFGCEDGLINLVKILEFTLNDGYARGDNTARIGLPTGHITDYDTFDGLYDAYMKQVRYFTKHFTELCNMGQEIRTANFSKLVKTPLTHDCIKKHRSLDDGGAIYNLGCVETCGVAVTADSLTAIKKLVYEEKVISGERLEAALAANFDGYEYERQLLINKAPKFGNDDDTADRMACRVLNDFWLEIGKYKSIRGDKFTGACSLLSSGTAYGKCTWATPDGRLSGEPLGNSIGPRPGADKCGLTAMLNSVAKLPLKYGMGGTTCNIIIPTSLMATDELRQKIHTVMTAFLHSGGQLGQITTADVGELIDAREHPELHTDLIIRIGGFSIRFCELGDDDKDEVIRRYS